MQTAGNLSVNLIYEDFCASKTFRLCLESEFTTLMQINSPLDAVRDKIWVVMSERAINKGKFYKLGGHTTLKLRILLSRWTFTELMSISLVKFAYILIKLF
jgi:hypothetical protein